MKVPIIKNIRAFLTIARIKGYTFINNYCVKSIVYEPIDCIIEIVINLINGKITFRSYQNNISFNLSIEDKKYLLKNIDFLVSWNDVNSIKE